MVQLVCRWVVNQALGKRVTNELPNCLPDAALNFWPSADLWLREEPGKLGVPD
jgi:hypothetical protein